MTDHPNVEVMRRALAALQTGDIAALSALVAPDVVWRVPGKSALAKDYCGRDEFFGFLGRLMELSSGTFRVESLELVEAPERSVEVELGGLSEAG